MKVSIKRVVNVKQKEPSVVEMKVLLADGSPAVVALSVVALTELIQRGSELFQLGVPVA